MRSDNTVQLDIKSSITQFLRMGAATWIIFKGKVIAVATEHEVTFPDVEHSRAAVKLINEFDRLAPHIRVSTADFDYAVASTGMRALRPLLGKPSEPTTPEEGAKQ